MTRSLADYVRARAKIRVTVEGCWLNDSLSVNDDGVAVLWAQGRTWTARTWFREWFGVSKRRLVPCFTRGCLCPLHQPQRKGVAVAL